MAANGFQRSWRPFNGWVVGASSLLTAAGALALAGAALAYRDLAALAAMPNLVYAVSTVLAIPGASLGISAWHGGMTQRIRAGRPGPLSASSPPAAATAPESETPSAKEPPMPQASADMTALQAYLAQASSEPAVQEAAAKLGVAADALEAALPILAADAASAALARMPGEGVIRGVQTAFVEGVLRKLLAAHETPSAFIAALVAEAQTAGEPKP